MPRPAHAPPELLSAPFLGSVAVVRGLLSEKQLRSRCWRRLFHDVYAWHDLPDDHVLRARAARLLLPTGAVISGPSAARLHGADVLPRAAPVEATVPPGSPRPRRRGIAIRDAPVADTDRCLIDGIPVTHALRTAFDCARRPGLVEGVVVLDALAGQRLVSPSQLLRYAADHPCWRGVRLVPQVVGLAEPDAESPMETRTRLVLVLGGLPRPEVQLEVLDASGALVARLDLGYRRFRLGIEYDGMGHAGPTARLADSERENRLRAQGWTLLRYTSKDVYQRPQLIVQQVRAALSNAA